MATFTINFNAQYPGEHRIGYRDYTYPANTYDNIDMTVNTPGSQSVEISIPHNLYCATKGVTFNCYVVAFCQNNGYVYTNPNGIPESAQAFNVVIAQQTDPCNIVTVSCDAVPIATAAIDNAGSGYTPGTYNLELSAGDEITAATIKVVVGAGGTVDTISMTSGNEGLYGTTPPTFVMPASSGEGVGGSGATFVITMGVSELDIEALTYDGFTAYNNLGSTYDMSVGDSLMVAADPAQAAIVAATDEFSIITPSGNDKNCHCQGCRTVTIDATDATTGEGRIIYNQCWDIEAPNNSRMITRKVLPGETWNLGCVDPSTVNVIQGTLNALPEVTEIVCP